MIGDDEKGVWVAYYHDNSAAAVYPSELEALRDAVGRGMAVHFVPWGNDVFRNAP